MALDVLCRNGHTPFIIGDQEDVIGGVSVALGGDDVKLVLTREAGMEMFPLRAESASAFREADTAIVVALDGEEIVSAWRVPIGDADSDMETLEIEEIARIAQELTQGGFIVEAVIQ